MGTSEPTQESKYSLSFLVLNGAKTKETPTASLSNRLMDRIELFQLTYLFNTHTPPESFDTSVHNVNEH